MSQQALAERARCSISMVALLEKGFLPASSVVLKRVEAVLNEDVPNDEAPGGEPGRFDTSSAVGGGPDGLPRE